MVGSADDKTCVWGTDTNITSNYDSTIKFGVDSVYGCNMKMTVSEYTTFCLEQQWKQLKIFNFLKNLQYIGIFGNAQISFAKVVIFNHRIGLKLLMSTTLARRTGITVRLLVPSLLISSLMFFTLMLVLSPILRSILLLVDCLHDMSKD
jgi:hypothetical protein